MDRKRRISCKVLIWCTAVLLASCLQEHEEPVKTDSHEVILRLEYPGYDTRGDIFDETVISDIDIHIYEDGKPEERLRIKSDGTSGMEHRLSLVRGRRYTIYAFVNFGNGLTIADTGRPDEATLELEDSRNEGRGIPMYGRIENIVVEEDSEILLPLTRLMAKISLRVDRSRLGRDVEMMVTEVSIGNCPKNASVFSESKARSRYDCFESGYICDAEACSVLNDITTGGFSRPLALYMLENIQGEFPSQIGEDEEKVLDSDDLLSQVSSYIELKMSYRSPRNYVNGKELIYRFYLGEGLNDLNIERNCHYQIDVTPEDDGLSGSGWRVDKSGIGTYAQEISLSDRVIDMTYRGEERLIEAKVLPEGTTCKEVIWESSDTSVATADADGLVTAAGEGRCRITCTAADRSAVTASCDINVKYASPSFEMFPGEYIEGDIGDSIRVWCEIFPPNAPFDPGYEELNYDKGRGIYDYTVDPDGKGVTLILKNPGTGIVYMTAGDPINRSGMTIVVVRSSGDSGQYGIPLSHPAFQAYRQRPDVLRHLLLQGQDLSPSQPHG